MTLEELLADEDAEHALEREQGRARLQQLGCSPAEIDAVLAYAELMHASQIARLERDVLRKLELIDVH